MTAPFQRSDFTHDTTLGPVPIPVRGVTGPAFFGRWMHLPGGGTASSGAGATLSIKYYEQGLCLKSMDFDI
jgi:hypothetical protein